MILSDVYEIKLRQLLEQGKLSAQALAQSLLAGQSLLELCAFVIDLELTDKQRKLLTAQLGLKADLLPALETAIPDRVEEVLAAENINDQKLRSALVAMSAQQKPADVLDLALENNRCSYEVFSAINGENSFQRLRRFHDLFAQATSTGDFWAKATADLALVDQLVLIVLLDLPQEKLLRLARALHLASDAFQQASPRMIAAQIATPETLSAQAGLFLANVTKDHLLELFLARDHARTVWFQTVGPNVLHTFSGVLDKTVPGYVADQNGTTLELPDFHLCIYENGLVKAQHFGIDGLLSTDLEIRTIAHTYRGELSDQTITLKESSIFAPNPKRPTLGNLSFSDFTVDASGLSARFVWKGKAVSLKWDPGF